jgi:hypothetical protein
MDGNPLGEETTNAPYSATWDSTTVADGPHTLTAVARDAAGNVSQAAVTVTVLNVIPDTTPPSVTITAPGDQSTASGSITITASANDDTGVVGVQFQVDGNPIGAEKLTAPYTATWDSKSVGDGLHTLMAIARDAAGNQSQASVIVDVLNVQPPPLPVPGLVAAYNFNEGSGAQILDVSGSGNTGVAYRTTWSTAGRTGSALSFGGNAWVTIADDPTLDLRNGMTLEAWVRPTSTTGARAVIYKDRNFAFSYALLSSSSSSNPTVAVRTNVDYTANGPTSIPTYVWTHLAATYDGSRLRLFVNGVEVDSRQAASAIMTSSGALRIGGNSREEYFRGLIDDVRIYNRALSAAEIRADMNRPVE